MKRIGSVAARLCDDRLQARSPVVGRETPLVSSVLLAFTTPGRITTDKIYIVYFPK